MSSAIFITGVWVLGTMVAYLITQLVGAGL